MEHLCPDVELLATCYNCGDHWLPPFRMCQDLHLACGPCARHLRRCECGRRFAVGPHTTYDWLLVAMKHRCKYRTSAWRERLRDGDCHATEAGCPDRWYTVQQLHEHYRAACTRNVFACPLNHCGHECRIDTAAEHYESAHGPFATGEPDPRNPHLIAVAIPFNAEVIKKIFNGYLSFSMGPPPTVECQVIQLTMVNINPADLLQYTYRVAEIDKKVVIVTVTVKNNDSL